MPMDRSRYPKDWDAISRRIRFERAGNQCEWCGVANYTIHPDTRSIVVLTVAHLGTPLADGTPVSKSETMDCRPENLAALCQRCHLNFDRADHLQRRIINRRARLVEAGQQEMF